MLGISRDGQNPTRNLVRKATAVDTYPTPARTLFELRSSEDASAKLSYDATGHVDARQGTIEFWLKTTWDWDSRQVAPHPSLVCIPLGAEPGRSINVYAYMADRSGPAYIGFYVTDGTRQGSAYDRVGPDGWKKNEWHHIAATWNEWRVQLFVDGKLIERIFLPDRLDLSAPPQKIYVACSPGGGISPNPGKTDGVVIENLRILNQPLNEITPTKREQP